jgi:hypothetical protein
MQISCVFCNLGTEFLSTAYFNWELINWTPKPLPGNVTQLLYFLVIITTRNWMNSCMPEPFYLGGTPAPTRSVQAARWSPRSKGTKTRRTTLPPLQQVNCYQIAPDLDAVVIRFLKYLWFYFSLPPTPDQFDSVAFKYRHSVGQKFLKQKDISET